MELGIDYVSSVGGDKGRTAMCRTLGFPVELLPGAVLDPSRGKTARIDFSEQIQRLKNANSGFQARIPSVGGLERSLSHVGVATFQSWVD
ncbi:unnamed protein product [Clonostachys rosea f. rosea IK726]|uniref:Uncharacterized protein n=2 Tax=Bionectria ochroleuca TaxID=29856 RepID=A0A0B7JIP3_BIOOC|nr:unnamed protein product [Clonostachys rosea f. rosea IK726]